MVLARRGVLLGAHPAHALLDVLRVKLATDPEAMERVRRERPEGPLAVSYDRGRLSGGSVPCRYDVIYATRDFVVEDVQYLYRASLDAGSDHALVYADLTL